MNERKEKEKEEEKDLVTASALGFLFVFLAIIMIFFSFFTRKGKSLVPGAIIGVLAVMLLLEVRKKAGSPIKIIKKAMIDDAPVLTFESAQKELENLESETGKIGD